MLRHKCNWDREINGDSPAPHCRFCNPGNKEICSIELSQVKGDKNKAAIPFELVMLELKGRFETGDRWQILVNILMIQSALRCRYGSRCYIQGLRVQVTFGPLFYSELVPLLSSELRGSLRSVSIRFYSTLKKMARTEPN